MLERQREGIAKAKGEGKYKGRARIAGEMIEDGGTAGRHRLPLSQLNRYPLDFIKRDFIAGPIIELALVRGRERG